MFANHKHKPVKNQDVKMSGRYYLAIVVSILVVLFLTHKGIETQNAAHPEYQAAGMTPGAIRAFADEPTVIPLTGGGVPVGVIKLNGVTYAIYTIESGQPR